ncbi:unnamed protein product [Thelazia callipaeda]|uniref:FNIP1 n=1 Tax=Thelazia callipaeda TaxID=103827 RepID=A0A0N5CJE5_THECL|nr:unnamed protein product [Thelazia callipaeda]
MVEKLPTTKSKIAASKLSSVRNSLFSGVSPLIGRNNKNSYPTPDKSHETTKRFSRCCHFSIKKLVDQDHFHYKSVKLGPIGVTLIAFEPDARTPIKQLKLQVQSGGRKWSINRSVEQLCEFDQQLHSCVFSRSYSHLRDLSAELKQNDPEHARVHIVLFLQRLSHITGNLMRCNSVLKFLEMDSHGNRLMSLEETTLNKPTIVSAIVTKNFNAETSDQISLRVCFLSCITTHISRSCS